jgi:hypothetical protein
MVTPEPRLILNLLFFTPHAALWPHTAPEAYLARALAECGHSINYLTCGKVQTYCAPMMAEGLAPGCTAQESARICSECKVGGDAIYRSYRLPIDTLARYLNTEDFATLDRTASVAVTQKSLDTEYLGVNVGRLALYEFTLAHKKMSTELNDLQWKEYQVYLANSLRTLHGFAIALTTQDPDVILTFSPQYSNINSCMQYAINQGVRVMFMESGTNLAHRLGTMRVWDWKVHKLVNPALTYWDRSEVNPVTPLSASKVTDHFEQLLSGRHFAVFSAPFVGSFGIRTRWGITPGQKILLMTLSSYDEAYAALLIDGFPYKKVFSNVFQTQAEWIQATIDWVATRPELFLLIRVHPRDFPNKRESMRSEQSFLLEDILAHVPSNVHVNWPAEGVSLYEILEDTDVVLTGWSVTAMEALVLGIPVVTYDENLPSYPRDIHYTGRTEAEYYVNVDRALADGWRAENAINGFRWLAYNFVTCTVTVAENFGRFELGQRPLTQRIWSRIKKHLPLALSRSLDLLGWHDALPDARIVSAMLVQGHDALPAARKSLGQSISPRDDRLIALKSLSRLHKLLYADSKLPSEKPGLSRNICTFLARENLQ